MGTQIITQPDGLFAVYASHSDTITVTDATEADILAYFVNLAIQDTTRHVSQILNHIKSGHPDQAYHQFALTWDEALAMDREHGGHVGTHYPTDSTVPGQPHHTQHADAGPAGAPRPRIARRHPEHLPKRELIMNAVDTDDRAGLDKHAPHPVDGHPDYEWYEDALGGEVHHVYWVPQVDAILPVGIVRPNPDRTTTNQLPPFLVEDADGEWIASGATVPELARLIVLHHRAAWLAAQHANAAADTMTATTDMDTAGWELCVELADFPTWWDEFGPHPRPLSGTDAAPTMETLLRDLGVDPDQEGRPDGQLRPSLELYYERAYDQAWHSALLLAARRRLRTP